METILIIFLLIIILIQFIILLDLKNDNKLLDIVIKDCAFSLDKMTKENAKLKSEIYFLKIKNDK